MVVCCTCIAIPENPLRAPLIIDSSKEVAPTLGLDSIRSGIKACVYGTLAVSAFMLVYYMIAGTAWIIPIGLMLPWMSREPRA